MNLDKIDKIFITGEQMIKIVEWSANSSMAGNVGFPIEEGVLIIEEYVEKFKKKVQNWVYFKINEDNIAIKNIAGELREELISFTVDENFFKTEEFSSIKYNKQIEGITEDMVIQDMKNIVMNLFSVFHYMLNNEGSVKEETDRVLVKKKQKNKKRNKNNSSTRYVKINNRKYTLNTEYNKNGKSFERHIDSWRVRGHYRYIKKTGKRVWVKPHVKGQGKIESKTYKV